MLKLKIFEKVRHYLEEYLFGFDPNQLQMSFLSGNVNLNNVNIRPDKVNEIFAKKNLPIALKAGLISKLSIKFNILNLFSDSLKITVEDLLFIVGPNIAHMSAAEDFETDLNTPIDDQNPLVNFLKMHQKVLRKAQQEKEDNKDKLIEEKKKKADKKKKDLVKAQQKAKEKKKLPDYYLKLIINLLGGLKLEVKRIHFRYEDDYFQHHKPFSFGFMVDHIIMDNADTDWQFEGPMSMGFVRNKPNNSKTVNKELNIKNVKVYWNSMSEMFVPTSLWEQTRHLQYQIFEAMDASFLKEIMVDAFGDQQNFQYNYLVQPFTIYTSINLNSSFNEGDDPYRYQINTLISQITTNLTPGIVRDMLKLKAFMEMFSYAKDLKRFRPLMRVQSFIEQQAVTPIQKKKKALVIRQWFQFAVWYIRLRKASKGQTPFSLLDVESHIQSQQLQNALQKAKKASLHGYEFPKDDSDSEEESKNGKVLSTQGNSDIRLKTEEMDAMAQYEKQQQKIQSIKILKEMLHGVKFSLRLEGIKAKVFTNKKIRKQHQDLPQLEFNTEMVFVGAQLEHQNLIAKILLKEIRLTDYFKRETLRSVNSRAINNISKQFSSDQNRPSSIQRHATAGNGTSNQKSSFAGMQGVVQGLFGRTSTGQQADYATPDKQMRLTDIIYGSTANQDRVMSRQTAATPYDYFSFDIPDPLRARDKTRETVTISDIIQNSSHSSAGHSRSLTQQQYDNQAKLMMDNTNTMNTTPARASKLMKAEKFNPSPTKVERNNAMNNPYLNVRSEIFIDDQLESVDKRTFFVMCGKTEKVDSAITIDIQVNIFEEPGLKKQIQLSVILDQMIIEYCNEILSSLTSLGLAYKLAFNFGDLKKAIGPNKLNRKRCLERMIQLQAPLYALRKALIRAKFQDQAIVNYQKKFYFDKQQSKTKADKIRETKEKQFQTIQKIKALDKKLNDFNFFVSVAIKNIYLGITADKDDHFVSNQTLLEFGIENQAINLVKQDFKCKFSVFGISMTTMNSFEMLFIFINKLKKVAGTYTDDLAVLTSINNYKEFIKNIKKNLEKQRQLKAKEDEKEQLRKGQAPQIFVMNEQPNQRTNGGSIPVYTNIQPYQHERQLLQNDNLRLGQNQQSLGLGMSQKQPSLGGPQRNQAQVLDQQQVIQPSTKLGVSSNFQYFQQQQMKQEPMKLTNINQQQPKQSQNRFMGNNMMVQEEDEESKEEDSMYNNQRQNQNVNRYNKQSSSGSSQGSDQGKDFFANQRIQGNNNLTNNQQPARKR